MKTSTIRRADAGSAMLLAVMAFVLMAGIGAALFSMAMSGQTTTLAASNADAAYHVAEAGIDDAINKMKAFHQAPGNLTADYAVIGVAVKLASGGVGNEVKGSFQAGNYSVTIEPAFAGIGDYKITSVGEARNEKRGIVTYISAQEDSGVFKYGLFGDVYMDAGGNIKTDGYNSLLGLWKDQITGNAPGFDVANMTGHVGSNGNVDISGSSVVYGNAVPGPSDSVTGGGKIYGTTTPAKQSLPLPDTDFTVPAGTKDLGAVSKTTNLASGTYSASSLSMQSKNTLVIPDNANVTLYVSGDIKFTGQSYLSIGKNAKLTIYQSGSTASFDLAGGSVTNSSLDPQALMLYTNVAKGKLTGNADFYGTVYAPDTAMFIGGTSGMFGSTIAKTIDIQGTPFFHYDEALAGIKTGTVSFAVKAVQQFVP